MRIERIQADHEPVEERQQRLSPGQQRPIRGQREMAEMKLLPGQPHQLDDIGVQQRLAAGEDQAVHRLADHLQHAPRLAKRQPVSPRGCLRECIPPLPEILAVSAVEVALGGDIVNRHPRVQEALAQRQLEQVLPVIERRASLEHG